MNSVKPLKVKSEYYEMMALLTEKHDKYAFMLSLGVYTGLRISDLLRLRVKDLASGKFAVTEQKTKNRRSFDLKADQAGREVFQFYDSYVYKHNLAPRDFLFYSTDRRKKIALSRVQAWRVIHNAAASIGNISVGPHSFRKTYARSLFEETKSITTVQRVLGHKSPTTTLYYLMDMSTLFTMLK